MALSLNCQSYTIYFEDLQVLNKEVKKLQPSRIFVLVDTNTEKHCLHFLFEIATFEFKVITIPEGEHQKNINTASFVWKELLYNGADRDSLLINLGGGVVGDLGGFCASTYMRGISYIQIPTTLLAQVDASVGSKTGIDLQGVKNIIGSFYQPISVIIHTAFLESLPYKELLSGFAEMLKHGLVADKNTWERLIQIENIKDVDFPTEVYHSVSIKQSIVSQDPNEKGIRKVLNFGHTIGHAIESLNLNTESHLLHGEAISIGMICEAYLSWSTGLIDESSYLQIKNTLLKMYGNRYKSMHSLENMLPVLRHDKKNRDGEIRFVLLEKIGQAIYDQNISDSQIDAAIQNYSKV